MLRNNTGSPPNGMDGGGIAKYLAGLAGISRLPGCRAGQLSVPGTGKNAFLVHSVTHLPPCAFYFHCLEKR